MFNFILYPKKNIKQFNNSGFTLIELLVVIMVMAILTAISLPQLIGNVGKAREAEATSQLGAINRSQQAHHFQTQTFATNIQTLLGLSPNSNYYNYPNPSTANDNIAKQEAIPLSSLNTTVRVFAGGIYHDSGIFQSTICKAKAVGETVAVGDNPSDDCTNNGVKIR